MREAGDLQPFHGDDIRPELLDSVDNEVVLCRRTYDAAPVPDPEILPSRMPSSVGSL
jgi:hypothetical protein